MAALPKPRSNVSQQILPLHRVADLARGEFEDACRALASPIYLGNETALCRIIGRYKLYVSTHDDGFSANVLLDGYWESWLTRFMARRVQPGATVVDVGANYGYYSLLLADLVGPEGNLHAVEPNPDAAALLRRSILLNGFAARTQIWEAAAGARSGGTAMLAVPEREPKNAAVIQDGQALPPETVRHEVAVRALDELLAQSARIDFIKIDAEGAEEAIIDGMSRILSSQKPAMVLEYNSARYADPAAFLDRLLHIYGALRHVDYEGEAVPVSPDRVLTEQPGEDWLLFLGGR